MIKVKANIKLYVGKNKRKSPFTNGYRPLFNISHESKVSGMITLLDRVEFKPGEQGIVEIKFLSGNCSKGTDFYFYESNEALGEGTVLEML